MEGVLNWLGETLYAGVSFIMGLLDICPFPDIISSVSGSVGASDGFAWLNWFVPVGEILALLVVWLSCLAIWYGISIVMRWIKAIE